MSLDDARLPLVVIVGPTAVGKTAWSIELAERLKGEIISADSRLLYRGMDIGTAKPSLAEREQIPHHLIDVTTPDQPWSLAVYQKAARCAISQIDSRSHLPMLVGGTGQYIQAVTEEWEIPAQAPDGRLRDLLSQLALKMGAAQFHRRLAMIDPTAARLIEPNNLRRTVRAFEVIFLTGQLFSAQRRKGTSPYRVLKIGLTRPRSALYARIDRRIEGMIEDGLLAEVKHLFGVGYSPQLPAFSAIGYREMAQVLYGTIDLAEAVILMKRYTRQFVRRQANWFKPDDAGISWFDLEQCDIRDIEEYVRKFLTKKAAS